MVGESSEGVEIGGDRGVTARLACLKLEQQHAQPGGTVRLSPVTGNSLTNKRFWKLTPSGTFEFNTINPAAYRYFELGEEYEVTMRKIPTIERLRDELAYHEANIKSLRETGTTIDGWSLTGGPTQVAQYVDQAEMSARPLRDRIRELEARPA
jgi:hypothetical protein